MIDYIKYSVRKCGVKYLARENLIETPDLDYYYILFKSVDDCYCQLEILFNLTDYFAVKRVDKPLLLGSNTFNRQQSILDLIETYPNFTKAKENSLLGVTRNDLAKYFSKLKNKIVETVKLYDGEGISIGNVHVIMKPSFLIIVEYVCNGVYMKPIQVFLGHRIDVISSCEEEKLFVDYLDNLSNRFKNFCNGGVI